MSGIGLAIWAIGSRWRERLRPRWWSKPWMIHTHSEHGFYLMFDFHGRLGCAVSLRQMREIV
jgi:hypothetical protein